MKYQDKQCKIVINFSCYMPLVNNSVFVVSFIYNVVYEIDRCCIIVNSIVYYNLFTFIPEPGYTIIISHKSLRSMTTCITI